MRRFLFLMVVYFLDDIMEIEIIALPFNKKELRDEGVFSVEEFKEWILVNGGNFLHKITNPISGKILIFSWIEGEGNWILVGDAIVKENHKTGAIGCNEDPSLGYNRHILTGGIRLYPNSVHSKSVKPALELRQFAKVSIDQYQSIISMSVEHWVRKKGNLK